MKKDARRANDAHGTPTRSHISPSILKLGAAHLPPHVQAPSPRWHPPQSRTPQSHTWLRVLGSKLGVLGLRGWGAGLKVYGIEFRVFGSEFRVQVLGFKV